MTLTLLALPVELIIRILLHVPPLYLVDCQLVNSALYNLIKSSPVLQYHIETYVTGVEDNASCTWSVSEKLHYLQKAEAAWQMFSIDFEENIPVKHPPSGIYDLSAGYYFLGNQTKHSLHFCKLPSRQDAEKDFQETTWSRIDVDKSIIDMGLAVNEHDLVAIVTTSPHETEAGLFTLEISLLKLSTRQPHPEARSPHLFVRNSRWEKPAIGIEIVGDNLALVTTFYHHPSRPQDMFYVYDWKKGVLKLEVAAPQRTYAGLLFLSPSIVLLPNSKERRLEYWRIPETGELGPFHPLGALGLPTLAPGMFISSLSCRCEPNPIAEDNGNVYADPPFLASAEDAIAIFNIRIHTLEFIGTHAFSMFVHRKSLLKYCPPVSSHSTSESVSAHESEEGEDDMHAVHVIPWEEWGPPVSCIIPADHLPTRWITTTAGQRAAIIYEPMLAGETSRILIVDFNPNAVRRAVRKGATNTSHRDQMDTLSHMAFEDEVEAKLEYVRYQSDDEYPYQGALLDEERIIGIHTNELDQITSVDVLHIGLFNNSDDEESSSAEIESG